VIVVCDTSTICYLVLIDETALLPFLFGQIVIPRTVHEELTAPGAPDVVQAWAAAPPDWLLVHSSLPDPALATSDLQQGEIEVLSLAQRLDAELVILDDKMAREVAQSRKLRVTGLLGILDRGARKQRIDLKVAVRRLQRTNFRISPSLLRQLLQKHLSHPS